MNTLELIGYKRKVLGKKEAKRLRSEAQVPCVLYGGKENVHFYTPMILFRELVYTPKVHFVNMDVEGKMYDCILQDIQFHPVSEVILHADFLLLQEDKEVKMEIPIHFSGRSKGLQEGGKLVQKLRKIKVRALPKNMPNSIEISIEGLALGKSVKVASIDAKDYTILNNPLITVASIEVPRTLRSVQSKAAEEGAAEGESAEA